MGAGAEEPPRATVASGRRVVGVQQEGMERGDTDVGGDIKDVELKPGARNPLRPFEGLRGQRPQVDGYEGASVLFMVTKRRDEENLTERITLDDLADRVRDGYEVDVTGSDPIGVDVAQDALDRRGGLGDDDATLSGVDLERRRKRPGARAGLRLRHSDAHRPCLKRGDSRPASQ